MSRPRSSWRIDQPHHRRLAGHEQGRLAGRVATAHHRHGVPAAQHRLHLRRGVVHARALEVLEPRYVELAVARPGGDEEGARRDLPGVVVADHVLAVALLEARRRARHVDLGAELLRLDRPALGQLGAGDPGGEAEVVLDPRGGGGLAADGDGVEQDRRETLRCAVDGRGDPGRTGADDDEVHRGHRSARELETDERARAPRSTGFA